MWKKNEDTPQPVAPAAARPARAQAPQKASVIGASIRIKGDLTGKEDLVIQGQLEGEVRLQANNVTVGKQGRIRADIYGRSVHVEGEVKGHLFGEQEVVIRASGKVQGDIVSPRVVLENGSNFKGSIDMEPTASKAEKPAEEPAKASPKEAQSKPGGSQKPPQQDLSKAGGAAPGSAPPKTDGPKNPVAADGAGAGNR